MRGEISPYFMRRVHGWGPNGKSCDECIFFSIPGDDPDWVDYRYGICTHTEAPKDFVVIDTFKACGLYKSEWQYERELLEAQGQQRIPLPGLFRQKTRFLYDLPPGAELADQDWTTPGFFPRTVH